jgi:hypothetical protein
MAEQVDQVQNEMIKELQMAYRAKQLKAEKQKKQLEEHQETLQHYRHLIAHYERTGDIARLLIVKILKNLTIQKDILVLLYHFHLKNPLVSRPVGDC